MQEQRMSRRNFVKVAALTGAGAVLAACQPEVVKETVVVEKEKVVTQVVQETVIVEGESKEVTKVVEKVITATPPPLEVTAHGRVLPADAAAYADQVWIEGHAENRHLDVARDIYQANSQLHKTTEPMLRRNQDQEIVPAVAESWAPGPKAAYWDFVIRKDCKWSDGTPLTADDWVFTGRHLCNPELDTPWVWFYYPIKGIKARKNNQISEKQVGFEKVDDRTVRIYGEKASAPEIPNLMAYQAAVPVPKHKAEADPAHWADSAEGMVGNGPFRLVEWTHNVRYWWEPNEYYNGIHTPAWSAVYGVIGMSDPWRAFQNYEIYLHSGFGADVMREIRTDPKLNAMLHWYANFNTCYLALDTFNEPLSNKKLRQALAHAIDKDTLSMTLNQGTTQSAYSMLPPGFPAFRGPELQKYQNFDLELAKSLLAEAGYPEGKDANGNQVELTIVHSGRYNAIEYVIQQWQDNLGIKVNYEVVEGGVWSTRRAQHTMQIWWGCYEYDYIDPSNMLTSLWRSVGPQGSPRHNYLNPEVDALLDAAAVEQDAQTRLDLFSQAEEILVEDVAAIFMWHNYIFQIWHDFVQGIPADKNGNVVWRGLDITFYQAYLRNDVTDYVKTPTR